MKLASPLEITNSSLMMAALGLLARQLTTWGSMHPDLVIPNQGNRG